ncbi:GDSL-like Lipase/Acylhydrolase [Colletotrichum scovillei]|uniref:GDSL lipase/acylhydrolase family protein n=1 Tax=Colletotrichum scovillei TaxID=1209932 RepID=A0A9P7R8X7_9PEZI|nr:GDSL-like Lipase/Acylhydrolase [Colletotrichum scovillei]KAF4783205.1 GDSL-like Lipase/Acylhydrolase [Colletotrichum scovillei]KAG7051443.1 GDSL lipase/acylhydrolase family protein [Colletotrichum scovillei]
MAKPYPQVVLFGDSLFQGSVVTFEGFCFQAELQCHVNRRYDVVNRGFSGWNSANALKYLPEMFPPPSPSGPQLKYLLVLLGANDAVQPMHTTTQNVPLEEYKQNLIKIVTHPNITAHNPKILLVTPPPIDEIRITKLDLAWGHPKPTRTAKVSAGYTQAAREVAAEVPGVVSIDLWQALMDHAVAKTPGFKAGGPLLGTPELGEQGGLHLSGEAYRVFYQTVLPHIGQEYVGLPDDDRTDYVFPDWRDLNPPA